MYIYELYMYIYVCVCARVYVVLISGHWGQLLDYTILQSAQHLITYEHIIYECELISFAST